MLRGTIRPELNGPAGFETGDYTIGHAELSGSRSYRLEWRGHAGDLFSRQSLDIFEDDQRIARAPGQLGFFPPLTSRWTLEHDGDIRVTVRTRRFRYRILWEEPGETVSEVYPGFFPYKTGYRFACGGCHANYAEYQSSISFSCRDEASLIPALFAIWYAHSYSTVFGSD